MLSQRMSSSSFGEELHPRIGELQQNFWLVDTLNDGHLRGRWKWKLTGERLLRNSGMIPTTSFARLLSSLPSEQNTRSQFGSEKAHDVFVQKKERRTHDEPGGDQLIHLNQLPSRRTHDEPGGDVQLVQLVKIYQLVGAPTMSLGEIRL